MEKNIPIPYQVILKRLEHFSFKDRMEVKKARSVLTKVCRIPKNLVVPVFNEMKEKGWIVFENHKIIVVVKKVDCDIWFLHNNRGWS